MKKIEKKVLRIHLEKLYVSQKGILFLRNQVFDAMLVGLFSGMLKEFKALPKELKQDHHQCRELFEGTQLECELKLKKYEELNVMKIKQYYNNVKNSPYIRMLPLSYRRKIKEDNLSTDSELNKLQTQLLTIGINFYFDI